ncbi:MAG: MFS transporter [Candidatus Kariarchaeaceae archaeon]|jgi:MFS family permease
MSFYTSFIGIHGLPKESKGIMKTFSLMSMINSVFLAVTSTFFILFIIDEVGFQQASIFTAIRLSIQLIVDYPSGSLGDYIGQRWILLISYTFYGIGLFLLAMAQTLENFLIVAIILGIASAQASGALQSWLDNNYQKVGGDMDPERKNYGYSLNRINTWNMLLAGTTFIIGGAIASIISRRFVFAIQATIAFISALLVLFYLKDIDTREVGQIVKDKLSRDEYFRFLKNGVKFIFSSKKVFFFIVGYSFYMVAWVIWGMLILFPIYFGYTGSDTTLGFLRFTILIIGVIVRVKTANLTKRVSNQRLPQFMISNILILFVGMIMILYFLPIQNGFNLTVFILLIILMSFTMNFISPFISTLIQRIMLDLVPSDNRNGVYSLTPTITNLVAIPLLPIIGKLVENSGLIMGVIITMSTAIFAFILILVSIHFMRKQTDV